MINTLTNQGTKLITTIKSFIVQAPTYHPVNKIRNIFNLFSKLGHFKDREIFSSVMKRPNFLKRFVN
jgi:hypothetical protein